MAKRADDEEEVVETEEVEGTTKALVLPVAARRTRAVESFMVLLTRPTQKIWPGIQKGVFMRLSFPDPQGFEPKPAGTPAGTDSPTFRALYFSKRNVGNC